MPEGSGEPELSLESGDWPGKKDVPGRGNGRSKGKEVGSSLVYEEPWFSGCFKDCEDIHLHMGCKDRGPVYLVLEACSSSRIAVDSGSDTWSLCLSFHLSPLQHVDNTICCIYITSNQVTILLAFCNNPDKNDKDYYAQMS